MCNEASKDVLLTASLSSFLIQVTDRTQTAAKKNKIQPPHVLS